MLFPNDDSILDRAEASPREFDRSRLDEVCNGNEQLRRRILSEYLATTPVLVSQLIAAMQAGDTEEVRKLAHTLKGSSRTIGAPALGEICSRIEDNALDPKSDDLPQTLSTAFTRLQSILETTLH